MADRRGADRYLGWSDFEIAADQALSLSTQALGLADGLLSPALDPIFARRWKTAQRQAPRSAPREGGGA